MAEEYFVRWKSIITGPFNKDVIKEMLRDGRVSKHHQVSSDKMTWKPLHDSTDFGGDCRVDAAVLKLASSRVLQKTDENEASAGENSNPPSAEPRRIIRIRKTDAPIEERWYYVDNNETAGPVSLFELRALVDNGMIGRDTQICREGEQRWQKAGDAFPNYWSNRGHQESYAPYAMQGQRPPVTQETVRAPYRQKSRGTYIVLGLFLGGLGIHNYYAGRHGPGAAQLIITLTLGWVGVGVVINLIWVIIELISITEDGDGNPMG